MNQEMLSNVTYGFKINQKQNSNMTARTVMSTEWIEVHCPDFTYTVRVFLTDEDEAYIVTIKDGKKRFFKVDPKLLKSGELKFFEKVMDSAHEIKENSFPVKLI